MGVVDELKAQAREIERELDLKLEELEKISMSIDPECFEVASEKNPEGVLQSSIERLITQLKYTAEQMLKTSESQLEKSMSNTYLQSHKTSLNRSLTVKKSIENKRWQQKLFGQQFLNTDTSRLNLLIREEKTLDESLQISKTILATAHEVNVSLAYQSQKLNSTSDKIVKFAEIMPGIGYLIKRISARQKFNVVILGLAVSVCICFIIYRIL